MPRGARSCHRARREQPPGAVRAGRQQQNTEPPDVGHVDELRRAADGSDPTGDAQLGKRLGARMRR